MADRVEPYYYQEVTEDEVEQWHDFLEAADQAIVADHDTWGITSGLVASENIPDWKIIITGGIAYDEDGQRIETVQETPNLSAYEPANPGEERWLAIYVEAARTASDARVDGDGVGLNYLQEESYALHVEVGAVGAPAQPRPAIVANKVLVCCVKMTNGMGTITNADIYQEWFNLSGTDIARQVGAAVAPGRLLGEEKRIAFDPAITDDVIVIGAGNTLDADGGDITMGAGQVDTEGGNVLLGAGDLDTEGGNVLAGAGNVDLETGHVIHATSVAADTPDAAAGDGHLYATPATGALIEVRKPWDIPAASMMPVVQALDPWTASGTHNTWALNLADRIAWQAFWQGPGAMDGVKLIGGIFVPNKSRLVRVTLEVTVLAALPGNLQFRCGVAYRPKGAAAIVQHIEKTYDNGSAGIWTAGAGSASVIAMSTTDAPLDIVLGDGLTAVGNSYFVFAYMKDLAGVGNNNYVRVTGGTANTLIREASHEY